MDFMMESCPYCGGELSEDESGILACKACGKRLYSDRADMSSFLELRPAPAPVEEPEAATSEDEVLVVESPDAGPEVYGKIMGLVSSNNIALATEEVVKRVDEGDDGFMLYLIRAAMHTRMGEDGKALADWKAALSRMDDVTGIDACVCLMAKTTSDMIIANELEFKKFDFIAHIDRMADMLDEKLGCSCKGHLYASVLVDFLDSYGALSEGEKENCEEVFIPMLKRLAAYGRDLGLVRTLSKEVLETMEYEDSSYESDDNFSLRVFYVICGRIVAYLPELGRCDFPSGWTDADMKAKLEPYLDAILACEEGVAPLDKYLKRTGIEGTMTVDEAVDDYVQRYLRIII
jgi:hypothetical protein